MTRRCANSAPEIGNANSAAREETRNAEIAPISAGQKAQNDDLDELDIGALIRFFGLLDKWDREARAMQKICRKCSGPAQFSVISVISTVGVSGRLQQSSPAVLFCNDC